MPQSATFHIDVQIDPDFAGQVDATGLQEAIAATLRRQSAPAGAAVTLVVTGDEQIHRLNRQFRQVDAPTDVLAFPATGGASFVQAPGQPHYLGDVILSYPRAAAQAADAGHSAQAELTLLAVHGTLHLAGHDHATPQEKAAMWAAQDAVLADCGLQIVDTDADIDSRLSIES